MVKSAPETCWFAVGEHTIIVTSFNIYITLLFTDSVDAYLNPTCEVVFLLTVQIQGFAGLLNLGNAVHPIPASFPPEYPTLLVVQK